MTSFKLFNKQTKKSIFKIWEKHFLNITNITFTLTIYENIPSYEKIDHKLLSKYFKSKSIRKHLQMYHVHVLQ